jgi:hypothetical protein
MAKAGSSMFERWRRLDAERRRLLVRAALTLAAASVSVAFLPFRRAIRFGSVGARRGRARLSTDECVWAIETAARYVPLRTMCIEKGLAAQRMLRSSGADARLHYGARHEPESGKLEAHVWVSLDGSTIIGAERAADFAEVATYA